MASVAGRNPTANHAVVAGTIAKNEMVGNKDKEVQAGHKRHERVMSEANFKLCGDVEHGVNPGHGHNCGLDIASVVTVLVVGSVAAIQLLVSVKV